MQKFFEKKREYAKITYTVSNVKIEDLKQCKLVVACSGGPDSMALFALCLAHDISVVAAHVNYHKRETADRDEQIVKAYAMKHDVVCEVLHPIYESGNFQNWAREVRYQFFYEVMMKHQCDGVVVAHHEDDVIETYLFQKKRKMIPESFGIAEKTEIQGCPLYRPLLHMRKTDLIDYCHVHQIVYGHDETNDTDQYTRNRIRHHVVEKMSESERYQTLLDLRLDNLDLMIEREMVDTMLQRYPTVLPVDVFERLSQREKILLLRKMIFNKAGYLAGSNECEDLIRQLSACKNVEISLKNCVKLSKMYHLIEICEKKEVLYSYVLERLELMDTEFFKLTDTGKSTEAVTLYEDDFPIVIRNARNGDAISLRFGTKKLNRWFIDRKIPKDERRKWPVMVNRHGDIILVPSIGCDCEHYSNTPTCFVVK